MTVAPLTFPKSFHGDSPSTPSAPADSPLNHAHFTELELANQRAKKIRRAARVAITDAWVCAIFAALTLLSGLFSLTGIILGLALSLCAWNSFRGANQLKNFKISAPKILALNQLALASVLILYALYCLYDAAHGNSLFASSAASDPALANMLAPYQQLAWYIALAIYGGLIIGTLLAQGLTAIYYATRKKHLAAYLDQTPAWILQIQKTQIGS